jgi:hypothetical protein
MQAIAKNPESNNSTSINLPLISVHPVCAKKLAHYTGYAKMRRSHLRRGSASQLLRTMFPYHEITRRTQTPRFSSTRRKRVRYLGGDALIGYPQSQIQIFYGKHYFNFCN